MWNTVVALDTSNTAAGVAFAHCEPHMIKALYYLCARGSVIRKLSKMKINTAVRTMKSLTAFSHCWRYRKYINALEVMAAVLALDWYFSQNMTGLRLLLLSNNTSVIGALHKGMCFTANHSFLTRRFAAVAIAHDLLSHILYVTSKINPADAPSRVRPINDNIK